LTQARNLPKTFGVTPLWATRLTPTVALAVAVLFWAWPSLAWACPSCAANDKGGVPTVVLIGIMILLPFTVATITWRVIRRSGLFATETVERALEPHAETP